METLLYRLCMVSMAINCMMVAALQSDMKSGKIEMYQFSSLKEERCCERIA